MARHVSGSLARIQFASQSAMKPPTVSRRPRARKARPVAPPTNGRPSVRRWSSQTIAGRSGRPVSSVTTTVFALGRDGQPDDRVAPHGRVREDRAGRRRRASASRAPDPAPPSRAAATRTARSGCATTRRATRQHRTRAPGRSGSRRRSRGSGGRRRRRGSPSRRLTRPRVLRAGRPRRHPPVRVEGPHDRLDGLHAERALLGREVRRVVEADAVLVADRRPVLDDHPARRRLERPPARERLVGVGREAEDVRRVEARPGRVHVRQVAEGMDALAGRLEAVAERPSERGGQVGEPRPVGRGLERVDRVARIPQRVAQVRGGEPTVPPGRSRSPDRRRHASRARGRPRSRAVAPTTPGSPVRPTMTRQRSGPIPRQPR